MLYTRRPFSFFFSYIFVWIGSFVDLFFDQYVLSLILKTMESKSSFDSACAHAEDKPVRRRRRRRRRHQQNVHNHSVKKEFVYLLVDMIVEEQAKLRQKFQQQQVELEQLRQGVEFYRLFTKQVDDDIEPIVHGICTIQRHIQDFDDCWKLRIQGRT